jgi:hypothetical protein
MSHIFISYSKKDIVFARHLKWLLEARGFRVWMDEKSIDPSDDWWETIEASVVNCAAFTVIMSESARQSRWVRREVLLAENLGKPLFPVLLDGQVWTQLADIQSADMTAGTRAELPDEFFRALKSALNAQGIDITPGVPRKRPTTRRRLLISGALLAVTLVAVALVVISNPFDTVGTPTPFDPVREAERLITETEIARIAFLTTPNYTRTVEFILNRFLTETQAAAGTNTPVPTNTPTATAIETEEVVSNVTEETEAILLPEDSDTPVPSDTPTATPNQRETEIAETQLAATLLQSAREEQETLEASCPRSPSPSRLRTGIVGRVTAGGLPSRLRAEPNTNGEVLVSIPSLDQFTVVDGPACDEQQLRWWQVDYQGTVGWIAEGVGEVYYLEPVPQ